MVLPFPPDEALVVYVTRGLDTSHMMAQAQGIVARPTVSAITGRKAMLRGEVWACARVILSASRVVEVRGEVVRGRVGGGVAGGAKKRLGDKLCSDDKMKRRRGRRRKDGGRKMRRVM